MSCAYSPPLAVCDLRRTPPAPSATAPSVLWRRPAAGGGGGGDGLDLGDPSAAMLGVVVLGASALWLRSSEGRLTPESGDAGLSTMGRGDVGAGAVVAGDTDALVWFNGGDSGDSGVDERAVKDGMPSDVAGDAGSGSAISKGGARDTAAFRGLRWGLSGVATIARAT